MQRDPGRPATRSPKDFWKERFGRYNGEEKEGDKDKTAQGNEEKEEAVPPKRSKASAKKHSGLAIALAAIKPKTWSGRPFWSIIRSRV